MERTLALIKPDAIMHATEICSLITGCFNILTEKICRLTKVQAEAFYREHEGKPFFEELARLFLRAKTQCGAGEI